MKRRNATCKRRARCACRLRHRTPHHAQLGHGQARQQACQWEQPVKQIHDSAFRPGTWALFDEDIQNYLGTTGVQFMSYDRCSKTSHKGAFGSTFITAGNALKTSDLAGFANARLDLFGPESPPS
jgi:hypothetical protein